MHTNMLRCFGVLEYWQELKPESKNEQVLSLLHYSTTPALQQIAARGNRALEPPQGAAQSQGLPRRNLGEDRSSRPRFFTRLSRLHSSLFPRPGLVLSVFLIFVLYSSSARSAQVALMWNPVTNPDLAGYKIYYGSSSRNYNDTIDVGNQTRYTITGLIDNEPYYFASTAYDIHGSESAYSNEVCTNCSQPTFSSVTRAQMAIFLLRTMNGSNYTPPPANGRFADVPVTFWAADWIEQLYQEGITSGCKQNPLSYCPISPVTRAQMAVFLLRTKHGSNYTPSPATGIFADVPITFWAADWIEELYDEGITSGCSQNPLRYCPESSVTRAQMAVFLLRTKHGSNYTPPPATGIFTDVPVTFWAADWIEQLYQEGITSGCKQNPLSYCP